MKALCPGSFDPVTLGHVDIIARAARLFDEVIVGVGRNVAKNALFSPEERVELLESALADVPGVRVVTMGGLLVDFCREQGIGVVVKGLRSGSDLDHEVPMAQMNAHLDGVETVLLPTAPRWSFVSSSLVREIAVLGGDVSGFVPREVTARLSARRAGRDAG